MFLKITMIENSFFIYFSRAMTHRTPFFINCLFLLDFERVFFTRVYFLYNEARVIIFLLFSNKFSFHSKYIFQTLLSICHLASHIHLDKNQLPVSKNRKKPII